MSVTGRVRRRSKNRTQAIGNSKKLGAACCAKKPTLSMVTAVVNFKLPVPVSREKAKELYLGTAAKYREVAGLVRKYYLLTEDGGTGGGVYLWKSKADAENLFTPEWKRFIKDRYGAEPVITFYESPVLVDNLKGEISSD